MVFARARPLRLMLAVTDPVSAVLVRGQMAHAKRHGFEVAVLSSPGEPMDSQVRSEGAVRLRATIARAIHPLTDARALWRIFRVLRTWRPDVANAGTPKAGLLVMLAAAARGVGCRIYTLHGLRFETAHGLRRSILRGAEWSTSRAAHEIICVSPSLRARAHEMGVFARTRGVVLGRGSCNGVNLEWFSPSPSRLAAARLLRAELGLPEESLVVGYVGRMVRDKGIAELARAWQTLKAEDPQVCLLLLGPIEEADALAPGVVEQLRADERVRLVPFSDDPVPYYLNMDVLALPTYREGFGNVLLEAAALSKPVVASRVTGCVDAVEDGVTGTLVEPRNAPALASALRRYLQDRTLRERHGRAGRERVHEHFRQETTWQNLTREYWRCIERNSPARGRAWLAELLLEVLRSDTMRRFSNEQLVDILRGVPPDLIVATLQRHGLLSLWHDTAKASGVLQASEALGEALTGHSQTALAHSVRQGKVLQLAAHGLSDAGLLWIVFGGPHLGATYYARPHLRPASRVDLLIEPTARREAIRVLEDLGFRRAGPPTSGKAQVLLKDQVALCLNWRLLGQGPPSVDLESDLLSTRVAEGEKWVPNASAALLLQLLSAATAEQVTKRLILAVDIRLLLAGKGQQKPDLELVCTVASRHGLRTAAWTCIRWATVQLGFEADPLLARLQPGRSRQQYLEWWLSHDPGDAYDRHRWLVSSFFSLALWDRPGDVHRALLAGLRSVLR